MRVLDDIGWREARVSNTICRSVLPVLTACRDALTAAEKAPRDAQARADAIDAAVYDLKAINPRTHVVRDNRTSAEIIESIASHGRAVDAALARLRSLLAADPTSASGD